MFRLKPGFLLALILSFVALAAPPWQAQPRRNVIVFIADGLRHGSVNPTDSPTLWRLRAEGVHFANSYSLAPTFTTANASAIATGHYLGDTGDFSNTVWTGHAMFDTRNFGRATGTPVPFLENDQILGDVTDHFGGNYLGEDTLLALARAAGYNTAAIGKIGPTAIQDISVIAASGGAFPPNPASIVVDDATGTAAGVPLPAALRAEIEKAGMALEAPTRSNGYGPTSPYNNGYGGDRTTPGTRMPNIVQQQWLTDVITRVVLPWWERDAKPFALVYWCRDPDATQHNEGDSLNALSPGINGPTVRAAVANADRSLRQVLDWLEAHPSIKQNTDLFVTSDHGFATISRREIDRNGRVTASPSAQHDYLDSRGSIETASGTLPVGFLALDLARDMGVNLFDADERAPAGSDSPFVRIKMGPDVWEHPSSGNGLLGTVRREDGSDATAIVAANGGSDLIYVPSGSADIVERIVGHLFTYDYVASVFVDDRYGNVAGTLPMSSIGFVGASRVPRPAILAFFKAFNLDPGDIQTAVQISDANLREGQGMHGGFGRDSTFNNMAAIGPDFKTAFSDELPASNADIVPTLAQAIGIQLRPRGTLTGRVLAESLRGGPQPTSVMLKSVLSMPRGDRRTRLEYREFDGRRYFHIACVVPATSGPETPCP